MLNPAVFVNSASQFNRRTRSLPQIGSITGSPQTCYTDILLANLTFMHVSPSDLEPDELKWRSRRRSCSLSLRPLSPSCLHLDWCHVPRISRLGLPFAPRWRPSPLPTRRALWPARFSRRACCRTSASSTFWAMRPTTRQSRRSLASSFCCSSCCRPSSLAS